MAMTMNGEVQLAAPREAVWTKLNDPEVLKACIPGCEELEKTEDNGFRAVAKMKVGPVSARFKGRVTLSDLDPPNGYKISGEGEGGVAGVARMRKDSLILGFWLKHRIESPRFTKVELIPPRNCVYQFAATTPEDVDDEVAGWLASAYEIGMQRV